MEVSEDWETNRKYLRVWSRSRPPPIREFTETVLHYPPRATNSAWILGLP